LPDAMSVGRARADRISRGDESWQGQPRSRDSAGPIQFYGELQQLRDRVPRDEPETIKDELAEVWRSLPDVTRAGRWPNDEGSALITLVTSGYLQQAD
jgi:hypothetical protein